MSYSAFCVLSNAALICQQIVDERGLTFYSSVRHEVSPVFVKEVPQDQEWPGIYKGTGFVFGSEGLYNKFGFEDGYLLYEFMLNWRKSRGLIDRDSLYSRPHDLLWKVVCERLLPAIGFSSEDVYFAGGVHNPARALRDTHGKPSKRVEVTVSVAELAVMADELFVARGDEWLDTFSQLAARRYDNGVNVRESLVLLTDVLEPAFSQLDPAYRRLYFDTLWEGLGPLCKPHFKESVFACVGALA